jgi:hypothetical protein
MWAHFWEQQLPTDAMTAYAGVVVPATEAQTALVKGPVRTAL